MRTSLVAQRLKHLPPVWESRVRSLGREDPLEKEMVTHSSILAWKIPWMGFSTGLHQTLVTNKKEWVIFTYYNVNEPQKQCA